jgi:poly-gamma-glutamate synthesis protein (capsule biosynthesis protein)
VAGRVIYDLGDFVDDYRVDPALRNDLGLLFLVTLDRQAPRRVEALPLKLDYAYTRFAEGEDWEWVARRLERACAALGATVEREEDRLVAIA